ncbi:unnamed protein product [Effrenium voratum]|uniref:Uncharacterized protein n=1 Tax=Effrenium voratum TaxID=2562239 RepID=A0AA36JIY2_9DINO|nr:unnamed protein product [Effrenium voratum]
MASRLARQMQLRSFSAARTPCLLEAVHQPLELQMAKSARLDRRRTNAAQSQAVALYGSPLAAASPYHAFAPAPPCLLGKPTRWPGPEGFKTTARLLWDEEALYVCWELQGSARAPVKLGDVQLEDQLASIPAERQSILFDERVECFVWQPGDGNETYFAFEINFDGKALTNRAKFGGHFDFGWDSSAAYSAWTKELPVGLVGDVGKDAATAASGGARAPGARVVIGAFRWQALGIDRKREIRIGLTRAQHPLVLSSELGQAEADAILKGMIWTTWVDPDDAEVNCHRAEMFGRVKLEPAGAVDCSCCAARLLGSKDVTVLRSPEPSLDECPPGSLLIRAKYASLCGSDFPYFRDMASRAASCYWDRDGFCGHEAVGVVVDSRSERFCVGDSVLSLPSSYFKAHVATRQEWFDEKVHGVLLEDFPVRGGFSEVFPSHELYTYKIKECVPRMLAAQALGTLLRMVRRLGTFIGKTVVILGQGQNGLLATRLMAQSCARHVIAVEPLASRRALATQFGATHAVTPQEAPAAVFQVAPKGADLVLEMVGHNQETIKEALELVAPCGIVTAFGVPDDSVYMFQYAKFFRKNATLVASVIPDPGVDFPEAVELVEQGRFSTEGIFTHTFPLSEIQKAFTIASEYQDNVVKVVLDLTSQGKRCHHYRRRSHWQRCGHGALPERHAHAQRGQAPRLWTGLHRLLLRHLQDDVQPPGQREVRMGAACVELNVERDGSWASACWQEGYTYYENWKEHIGLEDPPGGLARLRACGALTLRAPQSKVFLERVVASHRAVGLPFEEWDADEIRRRLRFDLQSYGPQVRIDDDSFGEPTGPDLSSGVYFPKTGYVSDPMLAACNLQAAAQATGRADFAFGREVTELLRRGGRAAGVRCGEEVFEAPVVINVAGPHSSQITRLAFEEGENDMAISTRPMRQEVAYVNSPPNVSWGDDGEGLLCTDLDTGIYFRPEVGGKILVGSVEPSCDDPFHIYPSDPEAVYPGGELASLTDQWTNQVYRLALRVPTLPLPEAGNVQGCAACYDVTEDWVPIYDKSALPGFYMAIGTSGNQFKNAGPAARLMRELIEAADAGRDTDVQPLDFELKRIPCGGTISSASFSRKRAVLETSGSVLG